MLTSDKKITTPEYWNAVYSGNNIDAKVDSSNTVRPPQTFDRFDIVVNHAEGKCILDIGSGHAHICKRIKARYPDSFVVASDQSEEAKKVANYHPYRIMSAYDIDFIDKAFDLVICTQAMEYIEDQDRFLTEAKRVGKKFLCTVPLGEMQKWSQLFIYNEKEFYNWMEQYGVIEVVENYTDLLLVKIKFND